MLLIDGVVAFCCSLFVAVVDVCRCCVLCWLLLVVVYCRLLRVVV